MLAVVVVAVVSVQYSSLPLSSSFLQEYLLFGFISVHSADESLLDIGDGEV